MRLSFREACELSSSIATSENIQKYGIAGTMELRRLALEDSGWTLDELMDEVERQSEKWIASSGKRDNHV